MRKALGITLYWKCLLIVVSLLLSFQASSYAANVTLQWDANTEPDLDGYRVYYKTGSSGNRIISDYTGTDLVYIPDNGPAQPVDSGFEIEKAGLPDPDGDTVTCRLSGLSAGETYYFVVTAYDGEGLESEASNEVATCSVAAPIVTGETPTNNTTPTWTWNSGEGEGTGTFRYKLDNSDLTSGTTETSDPTPITYTPDTALSEGSHTLYVQEQDKDNDDRWSGSGSFTIEIDLTSPSAPTVSGTTPTNDTTPTWSWSSGGGGNDTFRYELDDDDLTSGATETTDTSYTPGTALSEGSHTLFVQERDDAGSWSDSGSFTIVIDTTEPSAPGITTDGGNGPGSDYSTTDSSAALSGTCGADTVAIYVNGSTDGVTYTAGETSWTYTGTLQAGANTFTITSEDTAGNVSDAGSITVTVTTFKPDAPALSSPTDGLTDVSLTPDLQTGNFSDPDAGDTHAQSQWQMSTESDFSSLLLDITTPSHLTSLRVPQSILDEGTTYYWRVRFYDNNLAASDWAETYSFTSLTTSNDTNSNGIPDDQEVDSTVDLDGDGTSDLYQNDIACVNTVVGDGQAGVKVDLDFVSIDSLESIDPDTISDTTNKPESIPLGLITFKLEVNNPGDTAEVTLYFSGVTEETEEDLEDFLELAKWYMYDSINGWQDYSAYATFSEDGTSVTLEIIDGGFGDADGTANGIIVVGASGIGSEPTTPEPTPAPTFSGQEADGGGCFIATVAFGSR